MVVFDFLCAFVQRRLKCCSVIPKIIVRVTFNGWIWKDSTGVEMHKMKGDYYRYLAEFATGETKSKAGEDACVACAEATKIAEKDLVVTHLVRLAMALSSSVFQYEVLQNPDDIAGGVHVGENDLDDVPVVTQRQIPMVQRTRTLQCMDKVVDNLVVQVPRVQVVEKTVEIPQLQTVEEPAETPQTQTIQGSQTSESLGTPVCQVAQAGDVEVVEIGTPLPTESASPMFVSTPVPQVVEELAEAFKVFSQDRVQQRFGEQTIETPAISLDEKIVEMPVTRTQEKTQQVVNTHVQMSTHTTHQQLFTPTQLVGTGMGLRRTRNGGRALGMELHRPGLPL